MLRRSFAFRPALVGLSKIVLIMAVALAGCQVIKTREAAPLRLSTEAQNKASTNSSTSASPSAHSELEGLLAPAGAEIPLTTSSFDEHGEDFRLGDDHQARVTINVFSDFQCPACSSMAAFLHTIKEEFGDDVRIVFRNYPLDQGCNSAMQQPLHGSACKLAYLARCAGQLQKFWQFHDLAFKNQQQASMEAEAWAKAVGLGDDEIAACLTSATIKGKVLEDIALGHKLAVDSTPTLFINNRKYIGMREALAGTIRSLLNAQ